MANLGKENENIEFKESTAEFDKACKAMVGMLNKSGFGTVYFGVKDNGDVIGQNIGSQTLSNLADKIKESIKPSIYPTIVPMTIGDKTIISMTFSGKNKPYAYKGSFYIRVEQQNLVVDPLVLRELIKESHEYNDLWENEVTKFGVESIDNESVDMYYRQAVAMGRINKYDHTNEELLTQLNLMVDGKLTNAGLYLFGKNSPLVYKAVEYPTTERLNPIDLKRFEGNIFQLINNVINYINQKIRWNIEINDINRVEVPEIPIVAIREIVINSLVHCDYHADSEHQVTIDPENIEIYNPGVFGEYTPIDYVNGIIPSRTKHKVIQGIIFKAFDVETLGRGLKRMDNACKNANINWNYTKYNFGFSFVFYRKNKDLNKISDDAKILLNFMKKNKNILENLDVASKVVNKKERTTSTIIKELVSNKLIIRIGSKKNGYWKIID